jgi:hypothetical protein
MKNNLMTMVSENIDLNTKYDELDIWDIAERIANESISILCEKILNTEIKVPIEKWSGTKKEFSKNLILCLVEELKNE